MVTLGLVLLAPPGYEGGVAVCDAGEEAMWRGEGAHLTTERPEPVEKGPEAASSHVLHAGEKNNFVIIGQSINAWTMVHGIAEILEITNLYFFQTFISEHIQNLSCYTHGEDLQ